MFKQKNDFTTLSSMSLLDALDLDTYPNDTFDCIEFFDVRYINDEFINVRIGVRGYIVNGEESCDGRTYQVPLYDSIDRRKSIIVYIPVEFIDKLYNTDVECLGIDCEDCWHHDGIKTIYGIGYYRTVPRDSTMNRTINLDVIEPIQNKDTYVRLDPDVGLDDVCHIVDSYDVRYITDEHLLGIRGYIIIGEESYFDNECYEMPLYDNMDHRKSVCIIVPIYYIDLINSCYESNSLLWIDNKDRQSILGIGHYMEQGKYVFTGIEMTKSAIIDKHEVSGATTVLESIPE